MGSATIENLPLVRAGRFEDAVFMAKGEADVRLLNPDCVSDVTLPNAFGVVARFEKADCMGCNEVGGVNVLLNGLEGMAEANG